MMNKKIQASVVMVALIFFLGGCSQPLTTREKGALVGGGLGAASGAIIGGAVGSPGAGAAIGGAMGALGGGLVGDQLQGQENRSAHQQREIEQQNREIQRQRRDSERLKQRARSDEENY